MTMNEQKEALRAVGFSTLATWELETNGVAGVVRHCRECADDLADAEFVRDFARACDVDCFCVDCLGSGRTIAGHRRGG